MSKYVTIQGDMWDSIAYKVFGDASLETVNALSNFGDNLQQIMREVLEDVLTEKHRIAYV